MIIPARAGTNSLYKRGISVSMKINIRPEGVNRLRQNLQARVQRLQNLQPLWQSIGMYVQRQTIKERFDKEQAPDGTKWKPLSPARVRQRLRRHKSGQMKILQDIGELRRSVNYEAGKNYVRIGSTLKYARTHQFGRGKIPARPFLGVTHNEREHINNMFREYLRRHVLSGG